MKWAKVLSNQTSMNVRECSTNNFRSFAETSVRNVVEGNYPRFQRRQKKENDGHDLKSASKEYRLQFVREKGVSDVIKNGYGNLSTSVKV